MSSVLVYQVMCLLLFSSVNGWDDTKLLSYTFERSPDLHLLKNVKVWVDDQMTSLSEELLGSDTSNWNVTEENSKKIYRITVTAMGCKYLEIISQFIDAVAFISGTCMDTLTDYACLSHLKTDYNTYSTTVLNILSTTLYYSISLEVNLDKNFLKTLLTLQLYFKNDALYYPPSENSDDPMSEYEQTIKRMQMTSYIKYILESYTTEFCFPSTSSNPAILNKIKDKCSYLRREETEFLMDYIFCLENFLKVEYYATMPSYTGFDEYVTERAIFYPENFMLSKLLKVELVPSNTFSRLKYLKTNFNDSSPTIENLYELIRNDNNPDNIFKFQSFVIECLSAIVFYLISNIVKSTPISEVPISCDDVSEDNNNSNVDSIVLKALKALETLSPVGDARIALKNIQYRRFLQMNEQQLLLESIDIFFYVSNIKVENIEELLKSVNHSGTEPNDQNRLIWVLDNFIKRICFFQQYLFTTIDVINEPSHMLWDDANFSKTNIMSNILKMDVSVRETPECDFMIRTVQHFVYINTLVSECQTVANAMTTSNNSEKLDYISACFDEVKNLTRLIDRNFKLYFGSIFLNLEDYLNMDMPGLMTSFVYALLLFLNNNGLYVVSDNGYNESISEYIDFKVKALIRSHNFITNPLEQYINQKCNVMYTREMSTKMMNVDLKSLRKSPNVRLVFDQISERINQNINNFEITTTNNSNIEEVDFLKSFEKIEHSVDDVSKNVDDVSKNVDEIKGKKLEITFDSDNDENARDDALYEDSKEKNPDIMESIEVEDEDEDCLDFYSELDKGLSSFDDLELNKLMFEDIIEDSLTADSQFAFINDVKVEWDGMYLTIKEINNLVKNQINPHYLIEYQSLFVRVIHFMVYENIKRIIGNHPKKGLDENKQTIAKSLCLIKPIILPYHFELINKIEKHMFDLLGPTRKRKRFDFLIDLIETEQKELGVVHEVFTSNTIQYTSNESQDILPFIKNFQIFSRSIKKIIKKIYPFISVMYYVHNVNKLF